MKNQGRAYLRTDSGARYVDRKVGREVTLTYYPTSTSADQPLKATFTLVNQGTQVRIVVLQLKNYGLETLFNYLINV